MKAKRIISSLLAAALVFSVTCGALNVSAAEKSAAKTVAAMKIDQTDKDELLAAEKLGFSLDKVTRNTITGKEMTAILDRFVTLAAPDKLKAWKKQIPEFRRYNKKITRGDAAAALYLAAKTVGGDYLLYNVNMPEMYETIGNIGFRGSWHQELFKSVGMQRFEPFNNMEMTPPDIGIAYIIGHPSGYSGKFPIASDKPMPAADFNSAMTYKDGVLAAIRLISCVEPLLADIEHTPTKQEQTYIKQINDLRKKIQTAEPDCAKGVTGKIYYISNNGNDSNDGLSPQTAWKTLDRAFFKQDEKYFTPEIQNKIFLKSGDAVLLERGSTWYVDNSGKHGNSSDAYFIPDGVSVGAYGKGAKPVIRGDISGSNSESFWTLYSNKNGVKIWKAKTNLYDCPVVVFNEGESCAERIFNYTDKNLNYVGADGKALNVVSALKYDLSFCSLPDWKGSGLSAENGALGEYTAKGALYIRCDAGNPAKVYKSVSLPQARNAFAVGKDVSITGLDMRYFSMLATGASSGGGISYCDIGWCSGICDGYEKMKSGVYSMHITGCALNGSNSDAEISNNYIHDAGGFSIAFVHHYFFEWQSIDHKNIIFKGNLIERGGSGVHFGDYSGVDSPGKVGSVTNFTFEDNIVAETGCGRINYALQQTDRPIKWSHWPNSRYSALEMDTFPTDNKNMVFRNNLFYLGSHEMFFLDMYKTNGQRVNMPTFSGNTYVHYASKPLVYYSVEKGRIKPYYTTAKTAADILGDKKGKVIEVK